MTLATSWLGVSGEITFKRPWQLALLTSGVRENNRKGHWEVGRPIHLLLDTLGELFFLFTVLFLRSKALLATLREENNQTE